MPDAALPDLPLGPGIELDGAFACAWSDERGSGSMALGDDGITVHRDGARSDLAARSVLGWSVDDGVIAICSPQGPLVLEPPADLLDAAAAALQAMFGARTDGCDESAA